jgi:putative MATE family efflux protein
MTGVDRAETAKGNDQPANNQPVSVLVHGSVSRSLFAMAWPMLGGTFAMNAYGLTDAWFVARLGTVPLAAMAFAIPVVMLLTCIAGGLGTGVTTLMSHALGRRDKDAAARIVSHGMLLVTGLAVVLAIAGVLSMDWLFVRLGADAQTMPLIRSYMSIWYCGAPFMAMPWLGNGLLIASGDSGAASRRMILAAVLNAVLNPVLIYGWLGFPVMGIGGSAMATVIAQFVSTAWLLWLLHRRHRLLRWPETSIGELLASFRRILGFGIPGMMSLVLMPISSGAITWIISRFGHEAVAASGAAGRIEMVAFIIPMALGISLMPFVSQNFGAARLDRVREAFRLSTGFALIYGAVVAVVYILVAPWLAAAFSDDPRVVRVLQAYIRITSVGYGMIEVHRYCTFFMTGLHRPLRSLVLDAVRVIGLLIPLSYLGALTVGVQGAFWGRLISDVTAGGVGLLWVVATLNRMNREAANTQSS